MPRRLQLEFGEVAAFRREYERNVRNGGAFVPTDEPFEPRELVEVEVRIGWASDAWVQEAEVVAALPAGVAGDGAPAGVAIQFLGDVQGLRERLARYLESEADSLEFSPEDLDSDLDAELGAVETGAPLGTPSFEDTQPFDPSERALLGEGADGDAEADHGFAEQSDQDLFAEADHALSEEADHALSEEADHALSEDADHALSDEADHALSEEADHALSEDAGHGFPEHSDRGLSGGASTPRSEDADAAFLDDPHVALSDDARTAFSDDARTAFSDDARAAFAAEGATGVADALGSPDPSAAHEAAPASGEPGLDEDAIGAKELAALDLEALDGPGRDASAPGTEETAAGAGSDAWLLAEEARAAGTEAFGIADEGPTGEPEPLEVDEKGSTADADPLGIGGEDGTGDAEPLEILGESEAPEAQPLEILGESEPPEAQRLEIDGADGADDAEPAVSIEEVDPVVATERVSSPAVPFEERVAASGASGRVADPEPDLRAADEGDLGALSDGPESLGAGAQPDSLSAPDDGFDPVLDDPLQEVDDRRRRTRAPARLIARVDASHTTIEGMTRDVSESGVLISADGSELPLGKPVQLQLRNPETGEALEVLGTVRRRIEADGTVTAVAVQFDPDAANRRQVAAFVRSAKEAEARRIASGISGRIEELGIANLIQMLGQSSERGTLSVRNGSEEAVIAFEDRTLRYVRLGSLRGAKALARLLSWETGSFAFHGRVDALDEEDTTVPIDAALLEAARRMDEASRIAEASLDPATVFHVDRDALSAESGFSKVEEAVLDLATAGFTLRRILDVIPEADATILGALHSLEERGVLSVRL